MEAASANQWLGVRGRDIELLLEFLLNLACSQLPRPQGARLLRRLSMLLQ